MRKLFLIAALFAALNANGRQKLAPTLATSCQVCDSTPTVDWGDGTLRSVIEVGGAGYVPGELVRVTWSDARGPLWSFDCQVAGDGTFSEVWTDVPAGAYVLSAGQPHNRNKWQVVASVEVEVL